MSVTMAPAPGPPEPASCQAFPGPVVTTSSPHASARSTEAAGPKEPCRSVTAAPGLGSPQGADQATRSGRCGTAAIVAPTSRPGITAAAMPPATANRVRRRISPTPIAMAAIGHSDTARVTASVSMTPAWARRTVPPADRRNTPV